MIIALIDDELHRLQSILAVLPKGIGVVWALSGQMGECFLRSNKYDALLLDHDLGGSMDGRDVAKIVAETQDPEHCKIFIHSQNGAGAVAMASTLWKFNVTMACWENVRCKAEGMPEWLEALVSYTRQ